MTGSSTVTRALPVSLLILLLLSGCSQVGRLKARLGAHTTVTPASETAPMPQPPAVADETPSLAAIINGDLQHGRYAAGEQTLRRYLAQHPDDHAAQATLRQLTIDPRRALGRTSRAHVVQAGESWSTLAARHLGDASQFLILARYNGSTDPSLLRAGETVQLPLSAVASADITATGEAASPTPASEPTPAKARRLQAESMTLLAQGHRPQALARLDAALTLDPRLKPAPGAAAASLRKDVLAGYHQRAIVLYRDQQLDPAIALWDRVLTIDPGYEPASVYRTRALELKQRLKQF